MAQILVDHGIQVTVFGHDHRNDELLHVFHVFSTAVHPTAADCAAVASAVQTWATSGTRDYLSILPDTTFVDRVVATSIAEVNGPQEEEAVGSPGVLTAQALPSDNTLALKKSTNTRGRTRRGRFYVWAPTVAQLASGDSNLFDVVYVGNAMGAFNQLLSDLGSISKPMVVFSQVDGALYTVSDIIAVDNFVDSQRRRLARRGA